MTGFTTDYVNQIAINLRDRYKSGFPILKELVENADDAGAKSLAFGLALGRSSVLLESGALVGGCGKDLLLHQTTTS